MSELECWGRWFLGIGLRTSSLKGNNIAVAASLVLTQPWISHYPEVPVGSLTIITVLKS